MKNKNPYYRQNKRRIKEILFGKQEIQCDVIFLLIWVLNTGYIYSIKVIDFPEKVNNETTPFGRQLLMSADEFIQTYGIEWNNLILEKLEEIKKSKYDFTNRYLKLLYPIQLKED